MPPQCLLLINLTDQAGEYDLQFGKYVSSEVSKQVA